MIKCPIQFLKLYTWCYTDKIWKDFFHIFYVENGWFDMHSTSDPSHRLTALHPILQEKNCLIRLSLESNYRSRKGYSRLEPSMRHSQNRDTITELPSLEEIWAQWHNLIEFSSIIQAILLLLSLYSRVLLNCLPGDILCL